MIPLAFLIHRFIRLRPTCAKVLQTVSRFPSETHRPYAVLKSNAFTLRFIPIAICMILWHEGLSLNHRYIVILEVRIAHG
jgi:hypothetical protein